MRPRLEANVLDPKALRRAVGENLRRVRVLFDTNMTRMAAFYGVKTTTWRKWEIGETIPDAGVMAAFCDRYFVTMDWIYRGRLAGLPEDLRLTLYRAYPDLLDRPPEPQPPRSWTPPAVPDDRDTPPAGLPDAPAKGNRPRKPKKPPSDA